jgi:acetylornithine deacetylase/succinyl-diaminopimelate desuccinylase-like protein
MDLRSTAKVSASNSAGRISHSPAEYAKPEDLAAGARVPAAILIELAGAA